MQFTAHVPSQTVDLHAGRLSAEGACIPESTKKGDHSRIRAESVFVLLLIAAGYKSLYFET